MEYVRVCGWNLVIYLYRLYLYVYCILFYAVAFLLVRRMYKWVDHLIKTITNCLSENKATVHWKQIILLIHVFSVLTWTFWFFMRWIALQIMCLFTSKKFFTFLSAWLSHTIYLSSSGYHGNKHVFWCNRYLLQPMSSHMTFFFKREHAPLMIIAWYTISFVRLQYLGNSC